MEAYFNDIRNTKLRKFSKLLFSHMTIKQLIELYKKEDIDTELIEESYFSFPQFNFAVHMALKAKIQNFLALYTDKGKVDNYLGNELKLFFNDDIVINNNRYSYKNKYKGSEVTFQEMIKFYIYLTSNNNESKDEIT